jgi:timeless protein
MDRIVDNPAEATMASFMNYQIGSEYELRAGAASVLDNINRRLTEENKTLRSYRRALAFSKVLEKDLIPILINSQEDGEAFDAAVRLLVNLTVPVECLLPIGTYRQLISPLYC